MGLQGIRANIAKKPYIFVISSGGSGPPVPPSGSAHVVNYYGFGANKETDRPFSVENLFVLFVLLLYVPSQQLWSWRDGQFTYPHFFLGKLEQAVNQYFVHILSFVTDNPS